MPASFAAMPKNPITPLPGLRAVLQVAAAVRLVVVVHQAVAAGVADDPVAVVPAVVGNEPVDKRNNLIFNPTFH